ncbi:MAG: hypothetical protein J6Q13_01780 [Clostridia bacterium]|nr:hypothetical protein [Clostridia bacterium]
MGKHAIIVIKNNKGEYLQYFDERWNSFLFPNCKLINDNHKQLILECLINKFNLHLSDISIDFVTDKIHEKFSESDKIKKVYHHYFYDVQYSKIQHQIENKTFKHNNINFAWFSLNELENNKRIQEVNSDIVGFIKEIEDKKDLR